MIGFPPLFFPCSFRLCEGGRRGEHQGLGLHQLHLQALWGTDTEGREAAEEELSKSVSGSTFRFQQCTTSFFYFLVLKLYLVVLKVTGPVCQTGASLFWKKLRLHWKTLSPFCYSFSALSSISATISSTYFFNPTINSRSNNNNKTKPPQLSILTYYYYWIFYPIKTKIGFFFFFWWKAAVHPGHIINQLFLSSYCLWPDWPLILSTSFDLLLLGPLLYLTQHTIIIIIIFSKFHFPICTFTHTHTHTHTPIRPLLVRTTTTTKTVFACRADLESKKVLQQIAVSKVDVGWKVDNFCLRPLLCTSCCTSAFCSLCSTLFYFIYYFLFIISFFVSMYGGRCARPSFLPSLILCTISPPPEMYW